MGKGRVYRLQSTKSGQIENKAGDLPALPSEFGRICRARICKRLRSPGIDSRARIFKRLRSQGIDSKESTRPGWESIPWPRERFTNSGSVLPPTLTLIMYYLLSLPVQFQMSARARICKPFTEPMNRFPASRNRFLGIDSRTP
jgi:hypothetical protein